METKKNVGKGIIVGILVLFVGAGIVPSIDGNIERIDVVEDVDLYENENIKQLASSNSDNGVYDGIDLVNQIIEIFNKYNFKTEVLAASVRNKRQFKEVARAGVDIITVPFFLFKEILQHPRTEMGLKTFCENVVDEYRDLLK